VTDRIVSLFSRHRKLLMIAGASLLATLPVWLAVYPPMTDLPDHAAQIMLLRNLNDPNFPYSSFFQINWFTPYLLGYLLIYLLTPLAGIVMACKVVIAVSLAALPLSTALVMDETGTDKYWALLVIPAMYGFAYYWGFLNFIVAAPLGMVLLWAAMRHVRLGSKATTIWLTLLVTLLFFAHALTCGLFGLMTACYIWKESESPKEALVRMAPLFPVLPIMLFWFKHSHSAVWLSTSWDLVWFVARDHYYESGRISGFIPRLLGVEASLGSLLAGIVFFALPLLAGARLSRRIALWIPLSICVAALLLAPSTVYGTAFIYQRLTVFALPLYLILLQEPSTAPAMPERRWFRTAVPLIVTVWIVVLCSRVMAYNVSAAGFDELINRMEPYQRVLTMHFVRDHKTSIAPCFLHYGSWYAAQRRGMVDPNSAVWPVELIWFQPGKTPASTVLFEWAPQRFDWKRLQGENYRYFITSSPVDLGPRLFAGASCKVSLKYHKNIWWLYERDLNCPGSGIGKGGIDKTLSTFSDGRSPRQDTPHPQPQGGGAL
jgi:hypothetical protein